MRKLLTLTLALACGIAGAATAEDAAKAKPFISETYVIAPKQIAGFTLEDTHFEPAEKANGVSLRYFDPEQKQIRVDLFVYPAGKMPSDQAIERGTKDLLESFKQGEELGYYSNVEILDNTSFDVQKTDADKPAGDMPTKLSDLHLDKEQKSELPPGLEMLLRPADPIKGRRIKMKYTYRPVNYQMRSRAYLFYKQLYYFKGRISVAETDIDEEAFSAFSDRAMTQLVPAIEALNVGSCAEIVIGVDPDEKDQEKRKRTMLEGFAKGLRSQTEDNCVSAIPADELGKKTKDAEVIKIQYTSGDWGDQ